MLLNNENMNPEILYKRSSMVIHPTTQAENTSVEDVNLSRFAEMSLDGSRIPRSPSTNNISRTPSLNKRHSMIMETPQKKSNRNRIPHLNIIHDTPTKRSINRDRCSDLGPSNSKLKFNYLTSIKTDYIHKPAENRHSGIWKESRKESLQPLVYLSSTNNYVKTNKVKVRDLDELKYLLNVSSNLKEKFANGTMDADPDENAPSYKYDELSTKRPDLFEKLNMYERIMQFREVYFTGISKELKIKVELSNSKDNYGFDDKERNYKIIIGDHIKYKYEIMSVLGKGAFGSVVSVVDHSHGKRPIYACKIVKNDPKCSLQAVEEIKLLKKLNHGNILKYHEHFQFRSHMCIVTEILGISLYEAIQETKFRGFSLGIVRKLTYEILKGLSYLHLQGVIHCDLKPENIMFSNQLDIKIVDFGSSCYIGKPRYSYLQSRFYRAPEVLLGGRYDSGMDVWSLGLISLEMFSGTPIFQPQSEWELFTLLIEYLNVPSRRFIMRLREEIQQYGVVGFDAQNNNYEAHYYRNNTLLWKAFDDKGGLNHEYVVRKSRSTNKFKPGSKSLKRFIMKNRDEQLIETGEADILLLQYLEFIEGCLVWNKATRKTASQLLESPFFHMDEE